MIKKIVNYVTDPEYRFFINHSLGVYNGMDDEAFLKKYYQYKMGKTLNLTHPKTLNEKIQWLKIHDRKAHYTTMVDKYESKKYFATVIGEKYIIPTLGIYEQFDDIDFGALPDKFVLKTTHDSGGVIICKDKKRFSVQAAKKKIEAWQKRNFYYASREWPYKAVKPRIIVEQYLEELGEDGTVEFKLFCFNGKTKIYLVCKGNAHGEGRTNDFFDENYQHLPVSGTYPNAKDRIVFPAEIEELTSVAEKLAKDIPLLRVDFYYVNQRIFIGETTFYHDSGFCQFNPPEWDERFGKLLDLNM